MTSDDPGTQPGTHPSTDTLADLDAGLLGPDAAHDVRAHLAACPACAEQSAAFLAVRSALAGQPDPGPVPPDVADRIDAALAAAAAERGLPLTALGATEEVLEPVPAHRRLLTRVLAAAAVAGVVGIGAWAALGGMSGSDETTAGGADASSEVVATDAPSPSDRAEMATPAPESLAAEPEEAAPDAAAQDDAAGQAPVEPVPVPPSSEEEQQRLTDLTVAVLNGSAPPEREPPGCGDAFVESYGIGLLAAVPTTYQGAPAVMLVTPGPGFGFHTGYVVPTCDSLPGDELATVEVAS